MIPEINIDEYDYELPEERIAQFPVKERDRSRLLIYNKGVIQEETFRNIANHIPVDSLLVLNNSRVIKARFLFRKDTGAMIEIFCLEPLEPADYGRSFSSAGPVEWKCIIGNLRKWKSGLLTADFTFNGTKRRLSAENVSPDGEAWRIRFRWDGEDISFGDICEAAGHIPLPPYVKREDEQEDNIRYQTVYSKIMGSVAAPTAGLHFSDEILAGITRRGIMPAELTLHIGAGTFKPVKVKEITEHEMHVEHFAVTRDLTELLFRYRGKVIATGTTCVRTLESLYWVGVNILKNQSDPYNIGQWEPYQNEKEISLQESLEAVLERMRNTGSVVLRGSTKLMILPGYEFMVTSGMITNFHQPLSSLLLRISAWTGTDWRRIYSFALEKGFRFLSFGDTSLLL